MEKTTKFEIKDLDLYYGSFQALKKINLDIRVEQVVFDLPRCLQRISK